MLDSVPLFTSFGNNVLVPLSISFLFLLKPVTTNLIAGNNINTLSFSSEGQRFKMIFTGMKCQEGCVPLWRPQRQIPRPFPSSRGGLHSLVHDPFVVKASNAWVRLSRSTALTLALPPLFYTFNGVT